MTLLVEDVLLLLLDDETGHLRGASTIQVVLGGAVLAELAVLGCATVDDKEGWLHRPKVRATGPAPDEPLLAEAFATVADKPRTPQELAQRLGKGLKDRVVGRLVERGVLREEKDRVLGVFPRTRWPAADSTHEQEVRRAISATLVQGLEPDPRTGSLIALLSALDVAHKVLDTEGLSRREVRKRAEEVTEGEWAAKAVRDAIAATTAAVTAAAVAAATGAATSSG